MDQVDAGYQRQVCFADNCHIFLKDLPTGEDEDGVCVVVFGEVLASEGVDVKFVWELIFRRDVYTVRVAWIVLVLTTCAG